MTDSKKAKKLPLSVIIGLCLLLGGGAGFALAYKIKPTTQVVSAQSIREHTDQYQFIHPLLAVGRPDIGIPSPQYTGLARSVNDFISAQKATGAISSASVYFINYGKKSGSFALNEKEAYSPASLLKVVIMVAYLKKSDSDPAILGTEFTYAPDIAQSLQSVPFESPSSLVVGNTYSVAALINKMIVDSDNGAMNILLSNIDDTYLNTVYTNLGLQVPTGDDPYTISAQDYSLFFRILYNSTYLSHTSSEKALTILSKATFRDGLVAGLPSGTIISHKFGEHVNASGDQINSVELHDCGIIYPADGPYLLCVMTKGKDLSSTEVAIAGISKLVYQSATSK